MIRGLTSTPSPSGSDPISRSSFFNNSISNSTRHCNFARRLVNMFCPCACACAPALCNAMSCHVMSCQRYSNGKSRNELKMHQTDTVLAGIIIITHTLQPCPTYHVPAYLPYLPIIIYPTLPLSWPPVITVWCSDARLQQKVQFAIVATQY